MKLELLVNIILIVVGLVGGAVFYLYFDKDLSLIFFSISLAAILYQFLGGINEENQFNLGAIKFGSSAAVLIGFMFFFKKVIFTSQPMSQEVVFSEKNWLPIDKQTGSVIPLQISVGDKVVKVPADSTELLPKYKLDVKENEGKFLVGLANNISDETGKDNRIVGEFTLKDLDTRSLFNTVDLGDEELQIFFLYKDVNKKNSSNKIDLDRELPFVINVTRKGFFNVVEDIGDDRFLHVDNKTVHKRSSYLITLQDGSIYLVMVLQAHHEKIVRSENYSKWLVKRIEPKMNPSI